MCVPVCICVCACVCMHVCVCLHTCAGGREEGGSGEILAAQTLCVTG